MSLFVYLDYIGVSSPTIDMMSMLELFFGGIGSFVWAVCLHRDHILDALECLAIGVQQAFDEAHVVMKHNPSRF